MARPTRHLLLVPLTLLALGAASLAPATGAVPIPPGPLDTTVREFEGKAATEDPVRSRAVPEHPFMAANDVSNMHNDAYASDAYAVPGPLGRDLELTSATYGVEECATIAFDSKGRIEAMCGGLEGSRLMLLDPETLDVLAAHPMPLRRISSEKTPLEDICAGAYFYLDHRDRAVIATIEAEIWMIGQTETPLGTPGFELLRQYDVAEHVPDGDCLVALLPDWEGLIWFVTQEGGVGTVDPRSGRATSIRLEGEKIVNSFATDETGGVFIVSDHAMYRFDSDRRGRPRVTWRETYDRGSTVKPGQLSQGSGTTPTLVGRDLVVITDNADPRMRVIAYKRTAEPRRRRQVCAQPVLGRNESATENSIVAVGQAVLVENNFGYTGPASTTLGRSTAPGIARVDFRRDGCSVRWTSKEIAPTSVPKASLANGLLYVYNKPAGDPADPWYVAAIDVEDGRTVWRRLTGTGAQWNNHYAAIYLGPDGSLYVATLAGLIRLRDGS